MLLQIHIVCWSTQWVKICSGYLFLKTISGHSSVTGNWTGIIAWGFLLASWPERFMNMVVVVETCLRIENRREFNTEWWCHAQWPWLRASGQPFRMWSVVDLLHPHSRQTEFMWYSLRQKLRGVGRQSITALKMKESWPEEGLLGDSFMSCSPLQA